MRLRAICRIKGVWIVVEKKVTTEQSEPSSGTTENISAATRSTAKKEKASGIIISALGDNPLRVVIEAEHDDGIESEFRRHGIKLKLEGSNQTIGEGCRDQPTGLYVLPST